MKFLIETIFVVKNRVGKETNKKKKNNGTFKWID